MLDALGTRVLNRQFAYGIHHYVAEWLRICAMYLGIAVIVVMSTTVVLPGLRGKAFQVYKASLVALVPPPASPLAASERESSYAKQVGLAESEGADVSENKPAVEPLALAIPDMLARDSDVGVLLTPLPPIMPRVPTRRADGTVVGTQIQALRHYISRKYRVSSDATAVLINTAYQVGRHLKLDPLLLLAVMAIESSYNPFAESSVGAQGLMQVMPTVHQEKFEVYGKKKSPLDPIINIRVGGLVLRDCFKRRRSMAGALACYVGASGASDGGYGQRVLAERRRLSIASGIALAKE